MYTPVTSINIWGQHAVLGRGGKKLGSEVFTLSVQTAYQVALPV